MKKTKQLVVASLFAALCCIGTMIHIPTGITTGYIHLGDAMVLFSGIFLGPFYGGLSAGIGSMFADLINGYAIYVPGTFIIKALCAILCGAFFHHFKPSHGQKKFLYFTLTLSGILAECIMVAGYFIYEIGLFLITEGNTASLSAAVTSSALAIPFNLIQGIMAVILLLILIPVFLKINGLKDALYQ